MTFRDTLIANMANATRLVRLGDLNAATAAIQQHLRQDGATDGMRSTRDVIDGEFVADIADPDVVADGTSNLRNLRNLRNMREAEHAPSSRADNDARPGEGRFLSRTFRGHTGTRDYKLYVPCSYCGEPMPLIVMLHGCTQTPDDFAAGTRINAPAEEQGCLIAYPAQARGANASLCWNWFNASDQRREGVEPSIISGIVREIQGGYAVDARRIYIGGLSAGGAMAAIMAATHADVFAAACVHSGLPVGAAHDMASALAAMRSGGGATSVAPGAPRSSNPAQRIAPLIVFHGDRDATVSPRNADRLIEQWCAMAVAGDPLSAAATTVNESTGQSASGRGYTRRIVNTSGGTTLIEYWRLHGAGHAWSGGSGEGSYTDAKGPDASREMLRFFREHART